MPPLISPSNPSPSWIDEDTRQMVLKKTWCHGQLVAPIYSVVLLWWYFSHRRSVLILWIPILYFPYWCYLSYKNVFADFSYPKLLAGGIMAELCHLLVLIQSIRAGLDQTTNLLLCIASGLFLFETFAFLCVVSAFRPNESSVEVMSDRTSTTLMMGSSSNYPYHDSGRRS
ncbi:hypothetical protein IV203_014662 [Nitzschia inconspicua]|uniref:Uncharacterized protein n=1 Tax=Nitzschia inconspicua TaxID=303405 RepID=A0A9K3PSC4_9STRA|nr:hypothetical protein IV203_014662 [Nitzschia inconspicua]